MGPRMRNWNYAASVPVGRRCLVLALGSQVTPASGLQELGKGPQREEAFCPFRGQYSWPLSVAGSLIFS